MTEQTKAQRLANKLHHELPTILRIDAENAGLELRRMDANEAALVEALKQVNDSLRWHIRTHGGVALDEKRSVDASALITRIEAEGNAK